MKRLFFSALLCLVTSLGLCADTGTVSVAYKELGSIHAATWTWTNIELDGGSGTNLTAIIGSSKWLIGEAKRVTFGKCSSTNTTLDVYLQDSDGVDILGGQGLAVATNTVTSRGCGLGLVSSIGTTNVNVQYVFNSPLTLFVTNCFEAATVCTGSFTLYFAP